MLKGELTIDILAVTFLVISIILFITTIVLILKPGSIKEPQKKVDGPKQEKNTTSAKNKAAGEAGSVVINLVISPQHYFVTLPEEDLENNFYNDRFKGYED